MGNYVSCTFPVPLIRSAKTARVVLPGGEVRQFREPTKAAEVMLDCPNFFLVNSQSLNIGRRFSTLAADEELEFGTVYLMFPMRRVNSVVTGADMAMLFMAASSAAKRIGEGNNRKVGVLPETGREEVSDDQDGETRLSVDGGFGDGFVVGPGFKYRMPVCRSKKPLLATINEETVCLR